MALPPTIPTSFVPHSAVREQRYRGDYIGAFGFFAYTVFVFVLILTFSVFVYGRILDADLAAKNKKIDDARQAINTDAIKEFVRLSQRLNASDSLLEGHVAFSRFFSTLATIMPTTVRFNTLHVSFGTDGTPLVEGSGVAKSFNALAATSQAFADDGNIKDAIFSDLQVNNQNNSVSFTLSATLDQPLIHFTP